MSSETTCVVCGAPCARSSVVVADAAIGLCREHQPNLPSPGEHVFEDLGSFFERSGFERRADVDRRKGERRIFPPRPETRRMNQGRRESDPRY